MKNMSTNKLNKTYDSTFNILRIKNILDFSFGEDSKVNKKEEDVEMLDMAPKKATIKENIIKKINPKENANNSKMENDKFNPYTINNDNIIDFPESSNYLISKKRKRKNECSSKSIRIHKLKNHFPNKHFRNKSIKPFDIYEKMMGVKEDSLDNDSNEDNKNELDEMKDSKDFNFNNVYDTVLTKFNKINLGKKG